MVHMNFLSLTLKMIIYSAQDAQIALLLAKKVTILTKYTDFANVFSKNLAKMLPK